MLVNMKRLFFALACAIGVFCFCACSSDDSDGNSSGLDPRLVGTWETENKDDALTFYSNGKVVEEENDGGRDISYFLDGSSFEEWFESITLYHWDGEWNTYDNSKLRLHWKSGRYMKVSKTSTWQGIEDAEETLTVNYTISSDGKTLIEGDVDGEKHREPTYYYKK